METGQKKERSYPRRLPTLNFDGVGYFVDERLHEFRAVDKPHQRVDFESEAGKAMWDVFYLMDCLHCNQALCVIWLTTKDSIVCTSCGKDVPLYKE